MSLPDNRIKFPPTRIDFDNDVGVTGQEHDSYPAPGSQARYDWMRLMLIGLLSQQSSYDEPEQKRIGTPWFDLTTNTLKCWAGEAWIRYSEFIELEDGVALKDWYDEVKESIESLTSEIFFHGVSTNNNISSIAIPESVRTSIFADSRVFLTINGELVNPTKCTLIGDPPTSIQLTGVTLSDEDEFVVSIRRISASTFVSTGIVVP